MTPTTLRTILAAITIAAATQFSQQADLLVDFTRPLVMASLHVMGIAAVGSEESIAVGKLTIPWTQDCSGLNLLLILLAIAVWVNRQEKSLKWFLLRVISMIPAALIANVLRVLSLIGYRALLYPAVEEPQTHYFIGFLWLIPFVILITPGDSRPRSSGSMETLHAAAVVSLLAPISGSPNGALVSFASVICLSQCQWRIDHWPMRQVLMVLWIAVGVLIGLVNMESFWLPWLLICPLLADKQWMLRLHGLLLLACTHSLIAMQPWSWGLAAAGAGAFWYSFRESKATSLLKEGQQEPPGEVPVWNRIPRKAKRFAMIGIQISFGLSIAMPFLASTLFSPDQSPWQPPSGLAARLVNESGYEIKLKKQDERVGLICYFSDRGDRHHTLRVCLKYRGIELKEVDGHPNVMTEGQHYYREYFIQGESMHSDYSSYLKSSFRPLSDPGLHLIFVSLHREKSPAEFSVHCDKLAHDFMQLCNQDAALAQGHVSKNRH